MFYFADHGGALPRGKRNIHDSGTRVPLTDEVLRKLYRGSADYTGRVEQRLKQLMAEGWFLPEYADMVRADARVAKFP